MWGSKVIARKWPIGTVSECLKYNSVGKVILYVSDIDAVGENNFGGYFKKVTFAKDNEFIVFYTLLVLLDH